MLYRTSQPFSIDLVNQFLAQHQADSKDLLAKYNMYIGKHRILDEKSKGFGKPDNRLVNNFAKYIVDTLLGFFNGVPIQRILDDLSDSGRNLVLEFDKNNDTIAKEYEIIKGVSIFGQYYELVYQNEQAETKTTPQSPLNAFVVYDYSVEPKPIFGVRYFVENDTLQGEVYTPEKIYDLVSVDGSTISSLKEKGANLFHTVPLIEYRFTPEGLGAFDPVASLIDAYDRVMSQKANDVEYFSDAYLLILGAQIDQEQFDNMKDTRILNGVQGFSDGTETSKPEIKFLQKQESDETQEHLLNRIECNIRQFSMINEVTDEDVSSGSSGKAISYKLRSMENLAYSLERMLTPCLKERYRLLFSLGVNIPPIYKDEWKKINLKFVRNIVHNLKDEADLMQKLDGIVSTKTLLSQFSPISSVDDEMKQIEKEKRSIY